MLHQRQQQLLFLMQRQQLPLRVVPPRRLLQLRLVLLMLRLRAHVGLCVAQRHSSMHAVGAVGTVGVGGPLCYCRSCVRSSSSLFIARSSVTQRRLEGLMLPF